MKLRVSAFTETGLVVCGYITDTVRPEDASAAGIANGGGYVVQCSFLVPESGGGGRRDTALSFHHRDVCPFGWRSPSRVYATPGRHTNLGIVQYFDWTSCVFHVSDPETGNTATAVLGELELLPPLVGDEARPPWAVGAKVLARRHHVPGLSAGYIAAANVDLSYTIRFVADGALLDDHLHTDIRPWDPSGPMIDKGTLLGDPMRRVARQRKARRGVGVLSLSAASEPMQEDDDPVEEPVTVRSVVLIAQMGQHLGVIVQALGGSRYRALMLSSVGVRVVTGQHISCVRPVLYEALGGDPQCLHLFNASGDAIWGTMTWAVCKRILRESTLSFGQPIPAAVEKQIYLALQRRAADKTLSGTSRTLYEDGELPLSYSDFEFAMRRYRNAV